MRKAFLFSMILALTSGTAFNMIFFAPSGQAQDGIAMEKAFKSVTEVPVNKVSITVVFDNNPYREELTTSWGFACFIRGPEKTILFDTGGSSAVLLGNMQRLGIDPKDIDIVVMSHIHGDHVGGLEGFLKANLDVEVYLPATFPLGFKDSLTHAGIKALEVNDPVRICKGIYSTGVLGSWMKEQALIISTDRGLIVVTGCAHLWRQPSVLYLPETGAGRKVKCRLCLHNSRCIRPLNQYRGRYSAAWLSGAIWAEYR